MKILSSDQLRKADAFTIANEPIASIDLMERASHVWVEAFVKEFPFPGYVTIYCGTGNNGGDGLVIARLLRELGWDVSAFLVCFSENCSPDNRTNQERLKRCGIQLGNIRTIADFNSPDQGIIIDALVGTGITRKLEGLLGAVVREINACSLTVCSVDLPSGLFDMGDCTETLDSIVHADFTFTFQAPKLNFLLAEYSVAVGNWKVLDIGLNASFIESLESNYHLCDPSQISKIIQPRSAFSHKGTFGHAALLVGSYGMMGAAVLSTRSCLRSGVGLTTVHVPEAGYEILQTSAPEAMCITTGKMTLKTVPDLSRFTAIGAGPGLGKGSETIAAIQYLITTYPESLVLDADALNILSEIAEIKLPEKTIVTPHVKEFERLFGTTNNASDRLELLRKKAKELRIFIVLKGKFTAIGCPDGSVWFNPTGNSGMATGGSGDVLTGLITGLLAQGYNQKDACILGCYLHGLAGDFAANNLSETAMIASDIIDYLPEAFLYVQEEL